MPSNEIIFKTEMFVQHTNSPRVAAARCLRVNKQPEAKLAGNDALLKSKFDQKVLIKGKFGRKNDILDCFLIWSRLSRNFFLTILIQYTKMLVQTLDNFALQSSSSSPGQRRCCILLTPKNRLLGWSTGCNSGQTG